MNDNQFWRKAFSIKNKPYRVAVNMFTKDDAIQLL